MQNKKNTQFLCPRVLACDQDTRIQAAAAAAAVAAAAAALVGAATAAAASATVAAATAAANAAAAVAAAAATAWQVRLSHCHRRMQPSRPASKSGRLAQVPFAVAG